MDADESSFVEVKKRYNAKKLSLEHLDEVRFVYVRTMSPFVCLH